MDTIYIINIKIPITFSNTGEREIFYDHCQYSLEQCDQLPPKNECQELIQNIRTLLTPTHSSPKPNENTGNSVNEDENIQSQDENENIESQDENENIQSQDEPLPPPSPDPFAFILKEEIENRPKYHSQNISFKKKPKNMHRYTSKIRL
jgi:hypothetical protein